MKHRLMILQIIPVVGCTVPNPCGSFVTLRLYQYTNGRGSSPADGVDYFYGIALFQGVVGMLGFWHDLPVDFDGDPFSSVSMGFQEILQPVAGYFQLMAV